MVLREIRRWETGLKGFEFGIEKANVGVCRSEALSGRVSGGEAVLLEGAVEL